MPLVGVVKVARNLYIRRLGILGSIAIGLSRLGGFFQQPRICCRVPVGWEKAVKIPPTSPLEMGHMTNEKQPWLVGLGE